jgi:predicted ribosomally synthesized peptide with nif11-like leader
MKEGASMSLENVKIFYTKLSQDKALQRKLLDLAQTYSSAATGEANSTVRFEQEMLSLAAQQGYSFTHEELKAYGRETQHTGQELSDGELDDVTGGADRIGRSCDTAGGIITYDDGTVSFCGQVGN